MELVEKNRLADASKSVSDEPAVVASRAILGDHQVHEVDLVLPTNEFRRPDPRAGPERIQFRKQRDNLSFSPLSLTYFLDFTCTLRNPTRRYRMPRTLATRPLRSARATTLSA